MSKDAKRALMVARNLRKTDGGAIQQLLTQDVYHGTTKEIPAFTDRADEYSLSHGLGVHVARDPKVASSSYFTDRNATGEGGNMMPLKTLKDEKFYPVEQKLLPYLPAETPKGPRTVRSDDRAVAETILKHAFKRDPALLKRTLMEQRALSDAEASEAVEKLREGKPWTHYDRAYHNIDELVEDHLLSPWNPDDRAWASRSFRDHLIKQGYAGVKYINTSPNETEGVDDPTCYIVFNKPTSEGYYPLRGRFAAFKPEDKADPDLMKAEGGEVVPRTYGGSVAKRALMIARDQRALLRRIANIYPGPGGGMNPGPGGGGYAGPGGGKYIGPSRYADGGKVPPFKLYNGAAKLIEAKGQKKATPQQYAAMPGIKPDELKHSNFGALGNKALPREEVIKHLRENAIPLQETTYTGDDERSALRRYGEAKTALPGGDNYREVLLHAPSKDHPAVTAARARHKQALAAFDASLLDQLGDNAQASRADHDRREREAMQAGEELKQLKVKHGTQDYKSSHWDEPNVLAHIRMSDRRGPNGEKVLHVEEVQSDWGQEGREKGFGRREGKVEQQPGGFWRITWPDGTFSGGYDTQTSAETALEYRGKGVPHGPYVDNTQKWTDLALKRVLHEAAHGGYDKIAFTPGDEQNKRYDLSSHVKNIQYYPDVGYLHATTHKGEGIEHENVKPGDLAKHIGKEAADRILKQGVQRYEGRGKLGGEFYHELEGDDLKVGGSGMRGYYDNIMPKRLQALAQQHDPQAKVQLGGYSLRTPQNVEDLPEDEQADYLDRDPSGAQRQVPSARRALHSLDVTPQMRESIADKGFSQFKRGGEVEPKWVNPLEEAAAVSGHTPESLYPRLRKYSTDTINKLSDITPSSDWKNLAVLRSREALAPHKPLDPHKMIDSTLISAPGDLLATDMTIHGIGGNVFKNPVHLPGGPFYSRGKSGSAWASAEKAIADQLAAAKEAERQGSPAYHVPISMSRGAISSTPAVWSLLSEMIPFAKINKAGAAIIDKSIKTHPHPETGEPLFSKAPSIRHKNFPDWVSDLNLANRYQLMRAIEKSKNVVAGLPEPGVIRMASIEPEYLAPRSMSAGRVLSRLDPSAGIIHEPEVPHPGYPKQAKGTYHGGFERPAPVGLLFPKAWKTIAGNLDPEIAEVPNPIQRKLQLTTQTQRVTPELADQLAAYYERMRGKPFKQGGVVNRALNIARKVNAR